MSHLLFVTPCLLKIPNCRHRDTKRIQVHGCLKVAIAGGGLGGLVLASHLVKKGVSVDVYEQTTEYRKFGGPIQIQSNALALLADIDEELKDAVFEMGIKTGDRLAAMVDGPTGKQLATFDTGKAAIKRQLPLTHVIDRPLLQQALLDFINKHTPGTVKNGAAVTGYYRNPQNGVHVVLKDGIVNEKYDLLVGADGIWSSIRASMHNLNDRKFGAHFSGYRCYTATCKYICKDRSEIAYKVCLGNACYFVCSDVGKDRVQWYGFIAESESASNDMCFDKLRNKFRGWGAEVENIMDATRDEDIRDRYIYDRPPLTSGWSDPDVPVTLLGDSAHAMMPNLGQGGCMAIEDAHALGTLLCKSSNVRNALKSYEKRRMIRTSIVHGVARISSDLLRVYGGKSYLGWGLFWDTIGPSVLSISMPLLLEYLYVNLLPKKNESLVS